MAACRSAGSPAGKVKSSSRKLKAYPGDSDASFREIFLVSFGRPLALVELAQNGGLVVKEEVLEQGNLVVVVKINITQLRFPLDTRACASILLEEVCGLK